MMYSGNRPPGLRLPFCIQVEPFIKIFCMPPESQIEDPSLPFDPFTYVIGDIFPAFNINNAIERRAGERKVVRLRPMDDHTDLYGDLHPLVCPVDSCKFHIYICGAGTI